MLKRTIRCRRRSLSSIGGSITEGDCRPSRSVSSATCMAVTASGRPSWVFQSYTNDENGISVRSSIAHVSFDWRLVAEGGRSPDDSGRPHLIYRIVPQLETARQRADLQVLFYIYTRKSFCITFSAYQSHV